MIVEDEKISQIFHSARDAALSAVAKMAPSLRESDFQYRCEKPFVLFLFENRRKQNLADKNGVTKLLRLTFINELRRLQCPIDILEKTEILVLNAVDNWEYTWVANR